MLQMIVQPPASASATATDAVAMTALCKSIDERPILRDIDLRISTGEFVALLGNNGAGKSTLLRIIATLTPPSSGELRLFGQQRAQHSAALRGRIGLIAHQSMLYLDLTARENLEFFARLHGIGAPRQRVSAMLRMVSLELRQHDLVRSFSRGMTQRLSIARALLHDPELLLADEPFAGLDETSARSLEMLLTRLNESGKTILLINHSIEQTLGLARRIVVLRGGTMTVDQPAGTLTAADVLREMNPS